MPENQITEMQVPAPVEDEANLLDFLIVIAKYKKMILGVTLATAIVAAGISLLLPNIYTGQTRILPPQQSQSVANEILGQLGGFAGMAGSSLGLKDPNDLYVAILQSRNILEKIAKRFGLQAVYEQKNMTGTLRELNDNLRVTSDKAGIITVEVDDRVQKRAADMANAFVEELGKLMQTYALTSASQKRIFFEQQLRQAKNKLTDAELVMDRTPNTSLKYLDAIRNLKYQEAIWQILAKQFEMAKLDEAKDFPLLQILDKATPPEKKSKPKRTLIVILVALGAFFLAVLWAFVKETMLIMNKYPEYAERLRRLLKVARWSEK